MNTTHETPSIIRPQEYDQCAGCPAADRAIDDAFADDAVDSEAVVSAVVLCKPSSISLDASMTIKIYHAAGEGTRPVEVGPQTVKCPGAVAEANAGQG